MEIYMKKNRVLVLCTSILLLLSSCSSWKAGDFLEKGKNDGRFYWSSKEADKAFEYLKKYREKKGISEYEILSEEKTELNLIKRMDKWYLDVKVNDLPVRFFLDTGRCESGLAYDSVKLFGKNYDAYKAVLGEDDGFCFFVRKVEFANVRCNYMFCPSNALSSNGGASGVLGDYEIFNNAKILSLDLRNNRIIYNDEIPDCKPVKFEYCSENGNLILYVKIASKEYVAEIDTGWPDYGISRVDFDESNQIVDYDIPVKNGWFEEINDASKLVTVPTIEIGDFVLENYALNRVEEGGDYDRYWICDLILGECFFERAKLTFDVENGLCYVQPAVKK